MFAERILVMGIIILESNMHVLFNDISNDVQLLVTIPEAGPQFYFPIVEVFFSFLILVQKKSFSWNSNEINETQFIDFVDLPHADKL